MLLPECVKTSNSNTAVQLWRSGTVCSLIPTLELGQDLKIKHLFIPHHSLPVNRSIQAQMANDKHCTWKPILRFFSSPLSFFFGNRTTVHSCTTPGSMTMIVMMWVTAVTTAPTIVTQTKQTQTTTEREMPVLWTSMEMVRTGNFNKNDPCKIYIFMSVRSCFLSIYFVFIIFSSFHRHTEWEGQLPLCVQCWPERYRPGRSGRHVWQLSSGT